MMKDDQEQVTRRDAIKTIGVGVGVIASLPVLGNVAGAQELASHDHSNHAAQATAPAKAQPLRFFTDEENKTVIEMSERIIPADEHSPGHDRRLAINGNRARQSEGPLQLQSRHLARGEIRRLGRLEAGQSRRRAASWCRRPRLR